MTHQQIALRRSGIGLIVVGVFFALAALPPLHAVARIFLQVAYWPMQSVPAELNVPTPLLIAITGGLTAGLGGMMWALGTYVAPVSAEAAAKVTRMAAWTWFVTDSTASVLVGAPFNVVLNLSFLGLMLWASQTRFAGEAVLT